MARMTDNERCEKYNEAINIYNGLVRRTEFCTCDKNKRYFLGPLWPQIVIASQDSIEYVPQNTKVINRLNQYGYHVYDDISPSLTFIDGTSTSPLISTLRHIVNMSEELVIKPHGPLDVHIPNGYVQLRDLNDHLNGLAVDYVDNTCANVVDNGYHELIPHPDETEFLANKDRPIKNTYDIDDEIGKVDEAIDTLKDIAKNPVDVTGVGLSNLERVFSVSLSIYFNTTRTTLTKADVKQLMESTYTAVMTKITRAYTSFLNGQNPVIDVSDLEYHNKPPEYSYEEYLKISADDILDFAPSLTGIEYVSAWSRSSYGTITSAPLSLGGLSYCEPVAEYYINRSNTLYWINPNTNQPGEPPFTGYDFRSDRFWVQELDPDYCTGARIGPITINIPVFYNIFSNPLTIESGIRTYGGGRAYSNDGYDHVDEKFLTNIDPVYVPGNQTQYMSRWYYIVSVEDPNVITYTLPACSSQNEGVPLYTILNVDNPLDNYPSSPPYTVDRYSWDVVRFDGWWSHSTSDVLTPATVTSGPGYVVILDPKCCQTSLEVTKLLIYDSESDSESPEE